MNKLNKKKHNLNLIVKFEKMANYDAFSLYILVTKTFLLSFNNK